MRMRSWLFATTFTAVLAGGAYAQQYPIMDRLADKVVQKYQTSSCEQLAQQRAAARSKPKSPAEQRVIQMLHQDPQMRAAFFDKVSAPIVNKMFECGMIP